MKETANVLYPQSCSSFTKDSGKFLRRTSCCCYSNQKVNKRELCRGVKKRITISIIVFSFFPHSDVSTFCHQTPTCRRYVNVVFIEIIKKIQSFNVSEAKNVSASKGNRDESFKCPLSFSLHSSILYSLQFEGQKNIIVIKRDFAERYYKYTDIFCFPWLKICTGCKGLKT